MSKSGPKMLLPTYEHWIFVARQLDEIERLRKRNALLEDVAVAAENKREATKRFNKGMMCRDEYHTICDILDIELDKLREWSDE